MPSIQTQLQAQMGIVGVNKCWYVLLLKDLSIKHVSFDPDYWSYALKKVNTFYLHHFKPMLANECMDVDKYDNDDDERKGAAAATRADQEEAMDID